jgi:hypothetical protein
MSPSFAHPHRRQCRRETHRVGPLVRLSLWPVCGTVVAIGCWDSWCCRTWSVAIVIERHSAATKAPKPLDRRGVAFGATPSDAVLLPLEQDEAMRAAESSQLGGHPL